jgi:uncharacterized protein (TIGR01615 family)
MGDSGIVSRVKGLFKGVGRNGSQSSLYNEGSSRAGGSRRYSDSSVRLDRSVGKDSSTRSIIFDLELSQRGIRVSQDLRDVPGPPMGGGGLVDGIPHTHGQQAYGATIHRIRSLAKPLSTFEMDLLQDVQALSSSLRDSNDGNVPLDELASDLRSMGYDCLIQCVESHGMNDTPSNYEPENHDSKCLELLRHEFIICSGLSDGSLEHSCVVDPQFRDQFLLGQQSDLYEDVLLAVPEEFVGSPIRLQALVTVICAEMVKVYQDLGVSLPPWRRPRSVLGKWFDVEDGRQDTEEVQSSEADKNHQTNKNTGVLTKPGILSRVKLFARPEATVQPGEGDINVGSEKSNKPKRNRGKNSVSLLAQRLAAMGSREIP